MESTQETDVLVIGAGPVGLTAANLLADQGMRVMIVERRETTSDEPRAISVTDETLRVMAEIGIMDQLGPEMLMDTGARYYGRKGQLLAEVRPASPRLGQPGKSQFDQPVMETLLLEAARSRALIDIRFDTEAFRITDSPEHVDTVIIDDQGKKTVRSKWIVACDGGRSPVRAQLGIPMEGSTQTEKWIVVDILNTPGDPAKFAEFHCNGTRPAVVVPGVKGRRRYEFMLLPGEDATSVVQPEAVAAMIAPFQEITPAHIRRAAVYVAHQRVALNYRIGHVLLAGDAAHMMPPFAGQALNAGIRDVANVAWKIAANVRGAATEALLDTYASERRPHAVDMVRLSERIGKVVMSRNPTVTRMRDSTITALGIVPAAKNWLAGMKFLKQPHFTKGCVVPPSPGLAAAASTLVGRSLPQPRLRRTQGKELPMDDLLGQGWALVRFNGNNQIQITPFGSPKASEAPQETVIDIDGVFEGIPAGTTLIVRPDRYVAAATNRQNEKEALSALSTLLPNLGSRLTANSKAA